MEVILLILILVFALVIASYIQDFYRWKNELLKSKEDARKSCFSDIIKFASIYNNSSTLADWLSVPRVTIEMWKNEKNVPHEYVRPIVYSELFKKLNEKIDIGRMSNDEFSKFITMALTLLSEEELSIKLQISRATIARWSQGKIAPHKYIMPRIVLLTMEALVDKNKGML